MQQPVTQLLGELRLLGDPFGEIVSIPYFLSRTLGIILIIGGIVVFLCLLWGGFQWLTAGDDQSKIQNARERLTQCLVGFAILAISFAIAILAQYFLGINIFETFDSTGSTPPPAGGVPPPPPPPPPPPVGSACDITSTDPNQCGPCQVCTATSPTTGVCQPAQDGAFCDLDCWTAEQCLGGSCQPLATANNNCINQPCVPNDPLACGDNGVVCYDPDGDGNGTCTPVGDLPTNTPTPTPTTPLTPTPPYTWSRCVAGPASGGGCTINKWLQPCSTAGQTSTCSWSDCRAGQSACSTNTGSPSVNFGCVCATPSNIIINEYSQLNCLQLCTNHGFSGCASVGTDASATGGTYMSPWGALPCLTRTGGTCNTVMSRIGSPPVICAGHALNWTYCNCQ